MTHGTKEQLFETKYPEFEIVGGRVQIKNGNSSISIEDAFFLMAFQNVSIDFVLNTMKDANAHAQSFLYQERDLS